MNNKIKFREVAYNSKEYELTVAFRSAQLHEPFGKTLNVSDLPEEETQFHFAAFNEDNEVVGTAVVKPLSETEAQGRQMAVSPHLRGQGIGSKLIEYVQSELLKHGFETFSGRVRNSARQFYDKQGATVTSEVFEHPEHPQKSVMVTKRLVSSSPSSEI